VKSILATILLVPFLACCAAKAADPATITETELVRRTQQMFDDVAPGESARWKLYVADDAMIFDEKGRTMDKRALLDDLQPMPQGFSGSIKLVNPKSRFAPGVAVLSYDNEEVEKVFGHVLHARYHTTDTWLYRKHLWQIVASQTLRYYEDPAAGQVPAALLNDYVGTYQLAPGTVLTVTRQGDELYAQRGTGKPYKLLPETADLFFRAGVEGRKLFHRDAAGHVDMIIDRRNNEDLIWQRVSGS
jgi:hypothetical protein